jgi:tRNA modification GTPase
MNFSNGDILEISAKEETGIEDMEEKIYNFISEEEVEDSSEKLIITNIRHKSALDKTKIAIDSIFETIDTGMPMDLISVDLKEALDSLSEITGEISSEDILDHVFSNFCVGKIEKILNFDL